MCVPETRRGEQLMSVRYKNTSVVNRTVIVELAPVTGARR